jgi:zinc protease
MRHLVACVAIAALLLATSGSATANPYAPFAAPLDFRLANGLRIVAQRDARQPLVAFLISYGVGWRDDPPGYEGLAHLVEHMTYGGSRHLARYQMARELEHAGALRWNGATGPDRTNYFCLLSAPQLALPFWLESERMGFTLERFDAANLAHEKKILAKEALERAPTRVELELVRALFPGNHPYRGIYGSDASRVPLHGAQWFFQRAYRPDNATIVVVGDFDGRTLETLADRYFGPIPNPPGVLRRKPPEPREFESRERVVVTEHRIPQPVLHMVWPAPSAGSPETETFWVLLTLMQTRSAASINAAVHDAHVTESVRVMFEQLDGGGNLLLEIPLTAENRPEAVEYAVDGHFFHLRNALVAEAEVRLARDHVRMTALSELEDPLDHALQHLESLRASGHPFRAGDRFARIDAVTPASIRELARKYLYPTKRLAAWHRWPADGEEIPMSGTVTYDDGK